MLAESRSRFVRRLSWCEADCHVSQSQACLTSLHDLLRLMADCAPPLYFYFIQLPPGGWEETAVRNQLRRCHLAEVVVRHSQELLTQSNSEILTQSNSELFTQSNTELLTQSNSSAHHHLKVKVARRLQIFLMENFQGTTPVIPAKRNYRIKGSYKIVENISKQIIYI